MRELAAGNYDPVEADCRFHESIIAATNNRFYQPLGALVRTALSLTAPITNAIFGHAVGDLAAHGEVLLAIESKDEQRAFDLMRGLLSHVAREVAEAKDLPRTSRSSTGRRSRKVSTAYWPRMSGAFSVWSRSTSSALPVSVARFRRWAARRDVEVNPAASQASG